MNSRARSHQRPEAAEPLAPQAVCLDVLRRRYAHSGESTVDDVLRRVAAALSQAEAPSEQARWRERFLWAMRQGWVPAGRILAGAGRQGMLINCFVVPLEGPAGLDDTLDHALTTLRLGGGVGFDFSPLAPAGAWPEQAGQRAGQRAAGPLSAIQALDAACRDLRTPGGRSGAQMAVLRCDHPDILSFVHAKDHGGLSSFNMSVAVSDAFMHAVVADTDVELVHACPPVDAAGQPSARRRPDGLWVHASLRARALWREVMRCAHGHGEPGVLFMDRINADNNLSDCELIRATNPCAEQPLPPHGACCLGSLDLTRLVVAPFGPRAHLSLARLATLVKVAVRVLDNVLDLSTWPLPAQAEEARLKRRIGLGVTGLGDALVMLGLRYDAPLARQQVAQWMAHTRNTAYVASCELARERGAFPLFDAEAVLRAPHCASRLPPDIQCAIRRHGLRNSHLLSVAPAGSISLALCDNVSSGIEPVHGWRACRRLLCRDTTDEQAPLTVDDHAWRLHRHLMGEGAALGPAFITARDIAPADHVAMVAAVAPFVDGGISKTVNVREDLPMCEMLDLYTQAWQAGLKGLATYRDNAILPAALSDAPPCCRL